MDSEIEGQRTKAQGQRWVWGIAILVACALVLGPWSFVLSRSKKDLVWERIRSRGVFTVATDASYPPFSAVDENGNWFGFEIDLAEAIGRRWGVRVEFENI